MASLVPLMQIRHAAQVVVVGVEAFRRLAPCALDLRPLELRGDCPDDARGQLILQLEDVVEGAFEAVGPDMRPGRRIDELARDAHAVRRLAQAALQHIAHAELAAHLLRIHGSALVGEARVARDDEEPADARQRRDDVFHHAIGEIVLLGVAAQIPEGQGRDGGLVRKDELVLRYFSRCRRACFG